MLMVSVHSMQGNARVVNYTGIIRGATQRLVKNELYDYHDDSEITRLDDIMLGLQTGKGSQNINVLEDDEYLNKLEVLSKEWEELKELIYEYRDNHKVESTLYIKSEHYFATADKVVSLAESYSDGIARNLKSLEVSITLTIVIMLLVLLFQLGYEVRSNRVLNKIAYIDAQTGLPNKRGCDEKLNELFTQNHDKNVCCIIFDINNLKVANDNFGHFVGDALITSFASLLRRYMPENMFVGRFGGDEFIGIMENANKAEIIRCIEELKKTANQTLVGSTKNNILISFAYGWAFSDEYPNYTIKALMDIADKNMYENKKNMKAKLCNDK